MIAFQKASLAASITRASTSTRKTTLSCPAARERGSHSAAGTLIVALRRRRIPRPLRYAKPLTSSSGWWTTSTNAWTTSSFSPTRVVHGKSAFDWNRVLPPWFRVLSATAAPEEYAQRITGLLKRHCAHDSAKLVSAPARPALRTSGRPSPRRRTALRAINRTAPASSRGVSFISANGVELPTGWLTPD